MNKDFSVHLVPHQEIGLDRKCIPRTPTGMYQSTGDISSFRRLKWLIRLWRFGSYPLGFIALLTDKFFMTKVLKLLPIWTTSSYLL